MSGEEQVVVSLPCGFSGGHVYSPNTLLDLLSAHAAISAHAFVNLSFMNIHARLHPL